MTQDLKALRREMAETLASETMNEVPVYQFLTVKIDAALLRYAQAVLRAEASKNMIGAANSSFNAVPDVGKFDPARHFKAMSEQRAREIES